MATNMASAAPASDAASAEILAKLGEMQAALVSRRRALLAGDAIKLEEMSSFLVQMDSRVWMRLEVDEHAKEQARRMALVHTKLDALLTGSHEQVFHHFLLVPKPYKGYMGRTIDKLKPRHWFAKPMLLITLPGSQRRAEARSCQRGKRGLVAKPHDFVKMHPRVVQMAMLVLKAGIKMGAAQLGVSIRESLAALSASPMISSTTRSSSQSRRLQRTQRRKRKPGRRTRTC